MGELPDDLERRNPEGKVEVLDSLPARKCSEDDLDRILALLDDPAEEVRRAAAAALDYADTEPVVEQLMARLLDAEETRPSTAEAFESVVQGNSFRLTEEGTRMVFEVFRDAERPRTRAAVLSAISTATFMTGASYLDDAAEDVAGALREGERRTRIEAASVLARIGRPAVIEPLAAALDDPDPAVRAEAATSLGNVGTDYEQFAASAARGTVHTDTVIEWDGLEDDRATAALLDRLEEESDDAVLNEIIDALGWRSDPAAVEAVAQYLEDEDDRRRFVVMKTMAKIGGPAEKYLVDGFRNDPSERVRSRAASGLKNPTVDGREELERGFQNEESPKVRSNILHAIRHYDGGHDLLIEALAEDDSPRVRRAAADLLGEETGEGCEAALRRASTEDPVESVQEAARESIVE